jgi:hypothetical protein
MQAPAPASSEGKGFFEQLGDKVAGLAQGAKEKVTDTLGIQGAPMTTGAGVSKFVGAAPEKVGYTITGGRLRRKSRRGNKKVRKTRRRKSRR